MTPAGSVRVGLYVSIVSLLWTLAVGGEALVVGITTRSLALAAFGATGLLDAVGSASLIIHFTHARSRGTPSPRLEAITLRIVTVGLALTAIATATISIERLVSHAAGRSTESAGLVSTVSIALLALLAAAKRRIAARIPSHALYADSWVSAVGAALAAMAALGLLLRSVGWWWADASAAIVISLAALSLSAWLQRRPEAVL